MNHRTHQHGASSAKLQRRLKIVEGQVRGVEGMVASGAYCIDVITQISAIKEALSGVEDALLEEHLNTCVIDQIRKGSEGKPTEEIMKVYKLAKKRK